MNSSHNELNNTGENHICSCIEEHRTYKRGEVIGIYPWFDKNFWPVLVDLYGLVPLGTDKDQIVFGRNLIEALMNHACGKVVDKQRNPLTRKRIEEIRKTLKTEGDHGG